jgi:hypothetical protein
MVMVSIYWALLVPGSGLSDLQMLRHLILKTATEGESIIVL